MKNVRGSGRLRENDGSVCDGVTPAPSSTLLRRARQVRDKFYTSRGTCPSITILEIDRGGTVPTEYVGTARPKFPYGVRDKRLGFRGTKESVI